MKMRCNLIGGAVSELLLSNTAPTRLATIFSLTILSEFIVFLIGLPNRVWAISTVLDRT